MRRQNGENGEKERGGKEGTEEKATERITGLMDFKTWIRLRLRLGW